MFTKSRVCRGLVAAFGSAAVLAPMTSFAQEANLQRVEITGSNIRRTDAETPSPVQVISGEEIKRSGYTSVAEVLQSITANGQGTLSQSFSGAFATGAAGIALRGLNVGATLVLIDGHRMAPYPIGDDGQRSFVDISNIPFDSVERIEVLKDGASAVYGSDAIAGVVNIILRKSFKGSSITADFGESGRRDGDRTHVAGIVGFGDLDADGHTGYFSFEARRQNQIKESDRGSQYASNDFRYNGGYNLTPGSLNPSVTAITNRNSGTGYVTNGSNVVAVFPGCANAAAINNSQCAYPNTYSQIQPTTQNNNLLGKFTQKLGGDWTLALTGSYFQSKSETVNQPARAIRSGYQGITSGPGVTPTLLAVIPGTTVPNGYMGYALPTTGNNILHYAFNNLGPVINQTDSRASRVVGELTGTYGDWDLNASAGFTQVKLYLTGLNQVNPANLQTALNNGSFLVGQQNSADVNAFVAPQLSTRDTSNLSFAHVGAGRDLMKLPGGNLAIALGADYVYKTTDSRAPAGVEAGFYSSGSTSTFSNSYTVGKQNIASAYAELAAPILKNLEVDGAVRYDHYNLSGGRASPKLGFKYTPIPEFAVRATASRGFRAPSPSENGNAGQTSFAGTTSDPILCGNAQGSATAPGNFPSQCAVQIGSVQSTNSKLKPEISKSYTLGFIVEPVRNVSATFDYYQIKVSDQIVPGGDSTFVRGTNLTPIAIVNADGSQSLVQPPVAPIAYQTQGYINANATKTTGFDLGAQYRQSFGSIGNWTSNFMISHQISYDMIIDGVRYKLAGTHGPTYFSGATGNPRNKLQWGNTFARDNWSVTGMINYLSSFSVIDPSSNALQGVDMSTCTAAVYNGGGTGSTAYSAAYAGATTLPPGLGCKVASFTTFDLSGRLNVSKQLTLRASVLNLFGKDAPYDYVTYGRAGNAPYNPSLHLQGAIGRYFQVGATYTF